MQSRGARGSLRPASCGFTEEKQVGQGQQLGRASPSRVSRRRAWLRPRVVRLLASGCCRAEAAAELTWGRGPRVRGWVGLRVKRLLLGAWPGVLCPEGPVQGERGF